MISDIIYNDLFASFDLVEFSQLKCVNKIFREIYTKKLKDFLREKPWTIAKIQNPSEEIQLFLSDAPGNYIRYFKDPSFEVQKQYCLYNSLNLIYIEDPSHELIQLTFDNYKQQCNNYNEKNRDITNILPFPLKEIINSFIKNFLEIKNIKMIDKLLFKNVLNVEDEIINNIINLYKKFIEKNELLK